MIRNLKSWFYNLSIFKKQLISFSFVFVAFLTNFLVLYGAIGLMSNVRAYVNGEGVWAKAQKDAVISLREYILSYDPQDYEDYKRHLRVLLGARVAREELLKRDTDFDVAYQGFLAGGNEPKDIPGMIFLFENFRGISHIERAVEFWTRGDEKIAELVALGEEVHARMGQGGRMPLGDSMAYLRKIKELNHELTFLEDGFSLAMEEAARYISSLALASSLLISLISGATTALLIIFVSNFISKSMIGMKEFALQVSKGDFSSRLQINSDDEIGSLARSLNVMTENLSNMNEELDKRNEQLETKIAQIQESNQYLEKIKIATLNLLEDLETTKARLEEEKLRDEAILSSIGDGMIATDNDGVIILVNQRVEDLLGYKTYELIGRKLVDAVSLVYEDGTAVTLDERPIVQVLEGGGRVYIVPLVTPSKTYYFVRKNGTKFPAEIVVSPIELDSKLLGVVEVFRDITKEIEVERVKTEFVSIASHQLRTPLSTINWYSEILLSGDAGPLSKEQKEYLGEIYRGNQRMIDLVNALLNVSRLEVGAFIIEAKNINLINVARDVLNELRPQLGQKRINLIERYSPNLPEVQADYGLVRIILQNLLTNAIKYTKEGGEVGIEVYHSHNKIRIKVWDTGIGIPKAQHRKIFTKLFRADNARELDPDGTGLGLYIIKSIIDQTSGKLWFESEENKGTTFYLEVPINWMESKTGTRKLI